MHFGNFSYLSLLGFILMSQMILMSANFILNLLRSEAILKTKEIIFYHCISECLASKRTCKWVKISNALVSLPLTIWQSTLNALVSVSVSNYRTGLMWSLWYNLFKWWFMKITKTEECLHFGKMHGLRTILSVVGSVCSSENVVQNVDMKYLKYFYAQVYVDLLECCLSIFS